MPLTTPLQHNLHCLNELQPSLRYDGTQPFDLWQKLAYAKLWDLLGMDQFRPCDPQFSAEATEEFPDYMRTRFTFQSEAGYTVPGWWCVPRTGQASYPIMICLQGHSTGMHLSIGEPKFPGDAESIAGGRDFAMQALAHGYAALVIEQRSFGECGSKPDGRTNCYRTSLAALLQGRTAVGERVWDVMRAIDLLGIHLPGADLNHICCMGNSGGGTTTFYAACLEPRISAAMPSCCVCSYDHSIAPIKHCSCNHIPRIRQFFDMGDLAGLIAPRPMVVVAGEHDEIFPIAATKDTFSHIQKLYAAAGTEDRCALHVGAGGHQFYPEAWDNFLRLV